MSNSDACPGAIVFSFCSMFLLRNTRDVIRRLSAERFLRQSLVNTSNDALSLPHSLPSSSVPCRTAMETLTLDVPH